MPGRLLCRPGLFLDDGEFLARFAAGAAADRALFATRSLLERWQRELLRRLPGGALPTGRLVLFGGLAQAVLGQAAPATASDLFCQTALSAILARLAERGGLRTLAPLAGSPALAANLLIALGELRRGLIPRGELRRLAADDPRLADLLTCWQEYEGTLRDLGEPDRHGLLRAAFEAVTPERLAEAPLRSLLVHGFTDFSPLQARFLRTLAEAGIEVTILLPFPGPFPCLEILHRTVIGQFPGWEMEETAGPGPATRLGRFVAGLDPDPPDRSVRELIGEGEDALASLLAREIRAGLAADPTLRSDEIAVVRRETEPDSTLTAALRRHGLSVCDETGPTLLCLNGVGTILAALDCAARDWPRTSVLRLARGVLVGNEAPLAEALTRASARAGVVRSREAWTDLLAPAAGDGEQGREDRERSLAGQALECLEKGLALLPAAGTTAAYGEALRQLDACWDLPERWLPEQPGEPEMIAYAAETQGIERLLAALDEIAAAETRLGSARTWELSAFAGFLAGIASATALAAPAAPEGIRCVNPSEIRGLRFRWVFLMGLTEGVFPKILAEDWLLPEGRRQQLCGPDHGLELRQTLAAREWQLLGNVMASATESLYLCWSTLDDQGEPKQPSLFLKHLRERLAPIPSAQLRAIELLPRTMAEAWDEGSARGRLLADLLWRELPPDQAGIALTAYGHYRAEVRWLLARSRPGAGSLAAPVVRADLAGRFAITRALGVSALEDYADCPFIFFCRRLLGLEPHRPPEEGPSGLDLGLAYHAALERFFRRVGGEPLKLSMLPFYEKELKEAVAGVFASLQRAIKSRAGRRLGAFSREICLERLGRLLRAELHRAGAGAAWRTVHCELGFGLPDRPGLDPVSTSDPLTLGAGETELRLAGKIDRVDLTGRYFAIYDYKLGTPPGPSPVLRGRTLQIPIYLLAVMRLFFPDLIPAGGGYYGLRDLSRQSGLWRSDLAALTGISTRVKSSLEAAAWEETMAALTERILLAAQGIRAGDFRPTEDDCSPYCEFDRVCRKEVR